MAEHVTSPRASMVVFVVLLVLLVLTVLAAEVALGHALSIVLALVIAVTKAVLIIIYFMNVRFSDTVTRMASVAGFVGLAILLTLLMADYVTRSSNWREGDPRTTTRQAPADTGASRAILGDWYARNSSDEPRGNLVE
jgi:cytochrome c oxidase subunit 4